MALPPLPSAGANWSAWGSAVHDTLANPSASPELRAAFVAGRVLNNDGTVNTQKKLTVKLTADGTDIEDLIIEDVA